MSYSKKIAEQVRGYLNSENYHFDFDAASGMFQIAVQLEGCSIQGFILALSVQNSIGVSILMVAPFNASNADYERKCKIAEFILRANNAISVGNFRFVFENGRIAFQTFHLCPDERMDPAALGVYISASSEMFKRFLNGFDVMFYGNPDPIMALRRCGIGK